MKGLSPSPIAWLLNAVPFFPQKGMSTVLHIDKRKTEETRNSRIHDQKPRIGLTEKELSPFLSRLLTEAMQKAGANIHN